MPVDGNTAVTGHEEFLTIVTLILTHCLPRFAKVIMSVIRVYMWLVFHGLSDCVGQGPGFPKWPE